MTQIPLFNNFNNMKRKRNDSSPVPPGLGFPAPKKSKEAVGHAPVPNLDNQPVAASNEYPHTSEVNVSNGSTTMPFPRSIIGQETALETVRDQDQPKSSNLTDTVTEKQHRQTGKSKAEVPDAIALRDVIEAQFGLEILLKHKELRMIDQEFAKCQAALEQLRRCQVIPYPAMSPDYQIMREVSSGKGPVFNDRAPHAAPWGVANGPYSRHYERWLIPDPAFDEGVAEVMQRPSYGGKHVPDRATRGTKSDVFMTGTKSRSQRGSNHGRLQALPHGYPEPKEEKGPMIVKRASDGKMVKLVCLDCRRSNFNSAQGFINHCRIAHSRQFPSHDAAIDASGEDFDADAEGIVGEVNHGSQATASSALVHPLIRSSAHLAKASSERTVPSTSKRIRSQADHPPAGQLSTVSSLSANLPSPPQPSVAASGVPSYPVPFKPSPQTPHLSALFAKVGRGGDLDDMVNNAKARPIIDLSPSSDEEGDDDGEAIEVASGITSAPQSRSTRGVIRGGVLPARRSKSPTQREQTPMRQAFPTGLQKPPSLFNINVHNNYTPAHHRNIVQEDHHDSMPDPATPFTLSPNTIEAHTAPSLVSDDGDYENAHSDFESPSSAEDEDHYIHAEVMDHDGIELGEGSSADHHLGLGAKPHVPTTGRRTSAMRPPVSIRQGQPEQRRVSFASPGRRQKRGPETKDGN